MPLDRARRLLQAGLALCLAGALLMAFTVGRYAGIVMPTAAQFVEFGGFIVSGTGLLIAWVGWRTLRLSGPSQTVGRWHLTPDEWQHYVAACRSREAVAGALEGAVPLDGAVPPDGVEVLALRRGFQVGGDFHEISTLGAEMLALRRVDAPVPLLEFDVIYATGRTSSVRRSVRIPMASASPSVVTEVTQHWNAREPMQLLSSEALKARERQGWWIVGLGFAAFLGVVVVFAWTNPPGWAAVAPITALVLLFLGLFRAVRARNVRWRKFGR